MTDTSGRERPDVEAFSILAHGTGVIDHAQARRSLGLDPSCDDEDFARAVVSYAARASLPSANAAGSSAPPRPASDPVLAPRQSYILRMTATAAPAGLGVQDLDDVRTLLSMMRAGGLFQRRAAVLRIGELLLGETPIASDVRKLAMDTLAEERHFDLAYESGKVLASLPGGEGRAARTEQRVRFELSERVQLRVLAFWEGEHNREPIYELSAEERATLLPRARELSDVLIRHVSALIEDTAGQLSVADLRLLLSSLEHAGDPRLFPALRSLFHGQPAAVYEACVRAIASIEDPRVAPLLRDAYERAPRGAERLLLAAALGMHGDARGLSYARAVLRERDPLLLGDALGALAEVGGTDDVQHVADVLEHASPAVVRAAVVALGRIGDGRAIAPLVELGSRIQRSAMRADIEDAEAAIRARAELLGEEPPSQQTVAMTWNTRRMLANARARGPALVRFRAQLCLGLGYLCMTFGAHRRAALLFEAAAALRTGWLPPVLALALLQARVRDVASALAAFRRALDIDRAALEGDSRAINTLAMTFLRRTEAVEREGRLDIARGLVEEALSYDLRRASARARLGLSERREAHRTRER